MGNFSEKCADTRRGIGLAWTSYRQAVNHDEAKETFKRMGCLYCLAFFSLGKFICLALLFALPSVMIGMGAFHVNDCPVSPIIPIFLIVLGCYGVIETVIYGLRSCVFCQGCEIPLFVWEFSKCLVFGFFTWGSVHIFQIYQPSYDRHQTKYCDRTLYLFAFSIVTILWICMALFILMCLFMVALLACSKDDIRDDGRSEEQPPQGVDPGRGERSN